MTTDWAEVVNLALSALLNGSYQGLLLVGVVWILSRFLRRANAATRYATWLAALFIVATLPVAHLVSLSTNRASNAAPVPDPPELEEQQRAPENDLRFEEPSQEAASGLAMGTTPAGNATDPAGEDSGAAPARAPSLETGMLDRWQRWFRPQWESILPAWASVGLFAGWGLLAAGRLAGLGWSCRALWRLKRRAIPAPAEMTTRFDAIRLSLGVRRAVLLRLCGNLESPIASGFVRPAVLLPTRLVGMGADRFDQVVRHELAHLRRGDDWTNLAQQVIKALLFFHPGVWWLAQRLDNDREVACDDHVLAATPKRESYALLLTEFASPGRGRTSALAPAAWNTKTQIEERITMILDKSRDTSTEPARFKTSLLAAGVLVLAAGALQFGPRLALAQEAPGAPALPVPPAPPTAPVAPVAPVAGVPAPPTPALAVTRAHPGLGSDSAPAGAPGAANHWPRGKTGTRIVVRGFGDEPGEVEILENAERAPVPAPAGRSAREKEIRASEEGGSLETRLARLEKLVERLLETHAERKAGEAKAQAAENRAGSAGPRVRLKSSVNPRNESRRTESDLKFEHDFRFELETEAKAGVDRARRELARRRVELEAELAAVRAALDKLERDLRELPPSKPRQPGEGESGKEERPTRK